MLDFWFRGLRIVSSKSAYRELEDFGLGLANVKEVLEDVFDCKIGKRKNA